MEIEGRDIEFPTLVRIEYIYKHCSTSVARKGVLQMALTTVEESEVLMKNWSQKDFSSKF
jgi:hypothetical protein